MAVSVQQSHPIAHLPLILGVLRRLEVATGLDRLIPPHPAHGLSCGRGVAAFDSTLSRGRDHAHALSHGLDAHLRNDNALISACLQVSFLKGYLYTKVTSQKKGEIW